MCRAAALWQDDLRASGVTPRPGLADDILELGHGWRLAAAMSLLLVEEHWCCTLCCRYQRRLLSLGAMLPRVCDAIRIFGVRVFDQLALTVAKEHIAFAATVGDAPSQTGHRCRL